MSACLSSQEASFGSNTLCACGAFVHASHPESDLHVTDSDIAMKASGLPSLPVANCNEVNDAANMSSTPVSKHYV